MTTDYRPSLPALPDRLRRLPIQRGYPVPWFVARLPDGSYDFRVADGRKLVKAVRARLCWVCGQKLKQDLAFTIGPMCAVNRTTAEPPAHPECAHWSAQACPFLNQQEKRRRTNDLPATAPPPGEMLERQPGVTLVWTTHSYELFSDGRGGVLMEIGEPTATAWYTQGRTATRREVLRSIRTGLPALRALADQQGAPARKALAEHILRARRYLPAA